ncbi:MAG: FHA domain-containing protein [Planctomycetes bacterium]|nr:FHA domain-containing protein [Planctomycetota bacterium]
MKLAPGLLVGGRYRVGPLLGEGGAAVVHRARDERLAIDVALKVARSHEADQEAFGARVRREARIGFVLGKQPGIVRCLDWGALDGDEGLFMALELIEGARPLELGAAPWPTLLTAVERVAACHRKGVVHRDVKPQNFLVAGDGTIYLTDFGSARLVGAPKADDDAAPDVSVTAPGTLLGTPLFMSPEQFRDPAGVDPRADVFSLGVMLYHLLTGKFPFRGSSALEIMSNQVLVEAGVAPAPAAPRTVRPEAPEALERLCLEAIALTRDERPADADAFAERLAAATGQAPRAPLWTTGRRRLTRDEFVASLGVDPSRFAHPDELRAALRRLGPRLRDLLAPAVVLLVRDERPVGGVTRYAGRVALGLPLVPRVERVTVGRAPDCDLTLDLVTVSKLHLVLEREGGRWVAIEMGSSNGTTFNGGRLEPGCRQPVADGDELRVSDHVSLVVAGWERLLAHLG